MTIQRIREAFDKYLQDVEAYAKNCVRDGGGKWVGIQEADASSDNLVLFNSPQSGSTLALKATEITTGLVVEKIRKSDAQFKRKAGK
jgi:hypothetical protein